MVASTRHLAYAKHGRSSGQARDSVDDHEAIDKFAREKGVTRCPTACLAPTQGFVNELDREALGAHAVARQQLLRARAIAPAPAHLFRATLSAAEPEDSVYTGSVREPQTNLCAEQFGKNPRPIHTDDVSDMSEPWESSMLERAKRLRADVTTPAVQRLLKQMIDKYEMTDNRVSYETKIIIKNFY